MAAALKATALYSFQSSAPVELALQKGDIVTVRNLDAGDGWCEGELKGKRGLFPKAYVKMIDEVETNDDHHSPQHHQTAATIVNPVLSSLTSSQFPPPLTPQSNKKVFMETLLTPTPSTISNVFDEEKAAELFATDHKDIQIEAGPRWKHKPPTLTITVADGQKQARSSGVRLHKFYEVRTKELKVTVQRKFKHFLWLYDQLAEKFPCVSLPPLPIKHGLPTEHEYDSKESRRHGLERFLNRVAKHPILGCTKLLHVFLIATDDKEWRIGAGKHSSFIKTGANKSSKKLFSAPIYHTVHYPPYNVPLNQLPAFERFSKFSEVLEGNVANLTRSLEVLKTSHGQMSRSVRSLGKDLKCVSKGNTPLLTGVRNLRKASQGISLPSSQSAALHPISFLEQDDGDDDETDQDSENISEWNWREDEKFSKLMVEVHDLGCRMRQLASQSTEHQERLDLSVIEGLEEYSGIIHTLPVLVKMHEEAMAAYNECKQKGSKKEAETMRQDCETLNNILLSELDYFSNVMIEDFQAIILKLLKEQAEYHKKLAQEWESMYDSFFENRPVRKATVKRSVTMPGKKPANGTSSFNQQRPASTDELAPRTPDGVQVNGLTDDRLYVNVPRPAEEEPVYENWKSLAHHHSSDSNQPVTNRPIPPPLVIRRHEVSTSPEEAELMGRQTDSFIVPNLQHYSQMSTMIDEPTTPTNTAVSKKPIPVPRGKSVATEVLSTTSDTDSFSESSGEVEKKEIHRSFEAEPTVLESIAEEKPTPSSTYSPKMHTKLAKMTKLPMTPQATNVAPPSTRKTGPSKSFSQIVETQPPKTNSTKSLPRGVKPPPPPKDSSELFKKLNERRQKLERQLSGDIPPPQAAATSHLSDGTGDRDSSSSEGVLTYQQQKWADESKADTRESTSLSKFGIIEEGGTFTV